MPVHALENNAFSIEEHQAVLHFKSAESYHLADDFRDLPVLIFHFHQKFIKLRFFCTPEFRIPYGQLCSCHPLLYSDSLHGQQPVLSPQIKMKCALSFAFCTDCHGSFGEILCYFRYDRYIFNCRMRQHVQIYTAEYS